MLTRDEARKQAERLVDDVTSMIGGPIGSKDAAVALLAAAISEAYVKGWDDKQDQLARAMYPR